MDKKTTIKERFLHFAELKGISKVDFYKEIGAAASNFKGVGMKSEIGSDKIVSFLSSYPEVSADWLLTGKGTMLRSIGDTPVVAEPSTSGKGIPLYDVSVSAGGGSFEEMIAENRVVGMYNIPNFKRVDWMIYVKGSSMYPKYSSGDIIACRELHESRFIQWGKVYVIATREQGLLVKRIEEQEDDSCLLLVSDNPSYKPFKVPKDEICGMAIVVGVIRLE